MKLLIAVCTILVLIFTSSAEADCSSKSWKVVQNMSVSDVLGRWYAVLRFANGKNDTSDCLWHDARIHPTIPNTIQEFARRTFKNGEGRRKHEVEGVVNLADSSLTNGVAHVVYKGAGDVLKFVTAAIWNEFAIVRACFEGEGNYSKKSCELILLCFYFRTFLGIYEESDSIKFNNDQNLYRN